MLLLLLVILGPVPKGGLHPEATLKLQILTFSLTALSFLSRLPRPALGKAALPLAFLVAIGGLGLFQLLPLPAGLLAFLSPTTAVVHGEAAAVLATFSRPAPPSRISLAPRETWQTILLVLTYIAAFVGSFRLLGTRLRRRLFAGTVVLAAVIHVFVAVAREGHEARIHGVFYTNNFAGYLLIGLFLAGGFALREILASASRRGKAAERLTRLAERLVPLSLALLAWAVIATGIGLTRSRGGFLAAASALALFLFFASRQGSRRKRGSARIATTVAFVFATVFTALVTTGPLLRFVQSDPREALQVSRLELWKTAWKTAGLFPVFGTGLGAYVEGYRRVQTGNTYVLPAHNEYLQILVTGGLVGLLLSLVALGLAIRVLFIAYFEQPHREESAWLLAGLCAFLALALHGVVEFNFTIPSICVLLAQTLGLAWAAGAWRSAHEDAAQGA